MSLKFRGLSLDPSRNPAAKSASRNRSSLAGKFSRSEKRVGYALIFSALIFFALLVYFEGRSISVAREAAKLHAANPLAVTGATSDLRKLLHTVSAPGTTRRPWVVIIAVNYAYRDFALNFICNLRRLHITNYLALAMDRPAFEYLARRGAHVFFAENLLRVMDGATDGTIDGITDYTADCTTEYAKDCTAECTTDGTTDAAMDGI